MELKVLNENVHMLSSIEAPCYSSCDDFPYLAETYFGLGANDVKTFLQNLRPEIPRCCPNTLANVMKRCWDAQPEKRPEMDEVVKMLEAIDTSKGGGMIPEDQAPRCFCFRRSCGP